ncbi:hypothetical protein RB195_017399 [Necator americanus]|uniref:Uncharacterized protein n=1 Tax=Necator americanus TaxID=51031 RepID=A0ABR1C6L1_NECAM
MFPPNCRHGIRVVDWHITLFEIVLTIIAILDVAAIIYYASKLFKEKKTFEELHRRSEQQMAELQALQEKGLQVAVPLRLIRKWKKEQQAIDDCEGPSTTTATTQP